MIKNKDKKSKNKEDDLDRLLIEANKVNVKELMSNSLFTNKEKKGEKNKSTKSKKVVHKKNKHTKKHK
jgi:hypothetical protein